MLYIWHYIDPTRNNKAYFNYFIVIVQSKLVAPAGAMAMRGWRGLTQGVSKRYESDFLDGSTDSLGHGHEFHGCRLPIKKI
jgi:hypothetical protein